MRSYRVQFTLDAQTDLDTLFAHIADATSVQTAHGFVGRLRDHCLRLKTGPHRGTLRDDIAPGLRLIGYRRSVTIAFLVEDDAVVILRVLYRGRNVEALFTPSDPA